MTGSRTLKITGMDEIVRKLTQLPADVARKMERVTLKKALAPIMDAAIGRAPVGETGILANSFKTRTRTKKGKLTGEVISDAPHAHLVEYGHWLVRGGKRIKWVGSSPPNGFMRPALDENADRALEIVAESFSEELQKLESKK